MNTVSFLLDRDLVCEALPPETRLLDVIRQEHRLTGCKAACGEGDCGACMVLIGRLHQGRLRYQPAMACFRFLPTIDGKEVTTVHGLRNDDGSLHPAQQAMVDCHGSQCGFCTPGFVMSLFDLVHHHRCGTEREVREGLEGNLCRCTGYQNIVKAVQQGAQAMGR